MQSRKVLSVLFRLFAIILFSLYYLGIRNNISAQGNTLALYVEREIELDELDLKGSGSLAYSPSADVFLFLAEGSGLARNSVVMMDRLEHVVGSAELTNNPVDPQLIAFNALTNSLVAFDLIQESLLEIPADPNRKLSPNAQILRQHSLKGIGIGPVSSAAFDPVDGRLFALDPLGKRLLILSPEPQIQYDASPAVGERGFDWIDLQGIGSGPLRGLAYNSANQHLYTLSLEPFTIHEFTDAGVPIAAADISTSGLLDPQAIVIAPSGDHTDDPANQSIYVADLGRNVIVEFANDHPVVNQVALSTAFTVVNTIQSSGWIPPSPDPVGLDVFPNGDLLISDSEVDELPLYDRANIYQARPNGSLLSTCTTLRFSKEPTGVAINPADGMVFISDDVQDRVFKVDVGRDGVFCTNDDSVSSINTTTYGVTDPEGLAFGANRLIVTEGLGKQIIVVQPGINGSFDGARPAGDDTYTQFDTMALGLRDPEGVGYHPGRNSLFIVSRNDSILVETTLDGVVLNVYDFRAVHPVSPGGVGVGPGSLNPAETVVYIADRGVDNNSNPNENDGKIYELSIGDTPVPAPPPTSTTVPPTPTSTPVPPTTVPTATSTPRQRPTDAATPVSPSIYLPLLSHSAR